LLPLGREAAIALSLTSNALAGVTTAAPSSGSKLPRHRIATTTDKWRYRLPSASRYSPY